MSARLMIVEEASPPNITGSSVERVDSFKLVYHIGLDLGVAY